MRVPILTYHAVNVAGNDYAGNDHIAFAEDLRLIHAEGLRIVPLYQVVDVLLAKAQHDLHRCVALTCDDGTDYDYFDLDYPPYGMQRSFFNALVDFRRETDANSQPLLHLTSFVIASPLARAEMDRNCLFGQDAMNEHWWQSANSSGLMRIENHSWDHNHPQLGPSDCDSMPRGSFLEVNNAARAEFEIAQATRYLNEHLTVPVSLFCYPFSQVPDYLRDDYLPNQLSRHGMRAAFADGATPVTEHSPRWELPRYICGYHWKTPEGLRAILRDAVR